MSKLRWSLIGTGIGAAAGAATTAGVVIDRMLRGRRAAERLGTDATQFEEHPDHERVVITDDGVALHVEIDDPRGESPGETPTVVFSHGYTHDLGVWVYQRRALRDAGCRVVLWDLRGHGRSGEGGEDAYTIARTGEDLGTVIDEVVPEGPVVLIGHSMGAMSVMSLAGRRPDLFEDKVIGAAFISSSAGDLDSIDFGLGRRLGTVVHRLGPAAVTRLSARPGVVHTARSAGKEVEEYLVHRYSFATQVPLAVVRWTADMIFRTKLDVIGAFFRHLSEHDEHAALAAFIGIETLVVHGAQDRVIPVKHAKQIVDAIPGCEYVEVSPAGHVLPMEHPDLLNEELLALVGRARRAMGAGNEAKEGR